MPDVKSGESTPGLDGFIREFCSFGHNGEIGLEYVDRGRDWITFRLPWREELTASGGGICSSAIYSILDSASALLPFVVNEKIETPYPTLELRVDHRRQPASGTSLTVTSWSEAITSDISFTRALVHEGDPEDAVASSVGTFMSVKVLR